MFKLKICITVFVFSFFLIGTSFIKNQTREIEKNINIKSKIIFTKQKDLNESQLDFTYLTSPSMIEKKVKHLDNSEYIPMDHSKIFTNMSHFLELRNKIAIYENRNEKKIKKK